MADPNELTLTLKGAAISKIIKGNGELTVIFKNVQGGEISLNGTSHTFEGSITAAPNIITDSKTATGLKRLHDDGEQVWNKGRYMHTVKLPGKFGYEVPEAYLWLGSHKYLSGTYRNVQKRIGGLIYHEGHNGVFFKDRPKETRQIPYEYGLYEHLAKCAKNKMPSGWFMPTIEILAGCAVDGSEASVENNLYDMHKKTGRHFVTESRSKPGCELWSCTEVPGNPGRILTMYFNEPGAIRSITKFYENRSTLAVCLDFAR